MVATSAGPNPARIALAATGIVRNRSGPGVPKAGIASFNPAMASVKRTARPYRTDRGQSGRKSRIQKSTSRSPIASTPEVPPARSFRNLTRPRKPNVSRGRLLRGLAESPAAEEPDDRSHDDGLKDLIARVDRVQARGPAGEEGLRKERGRRESKRRVEANERATGPGDPAGLVDEPVERDGFDERRKRGERVQRTSRLASTHASTSESHPRLAEDRSVPEESDDHCSGGCDDDRYPVHLPLLQRASGRKAKARAQASRPRGRTRRTPDRSVRGGAAPRSSPGDTAPGRSQEVSPRSEPGCRSRGRRPRSADRDPCRGGDGRCGTGLCARARDRGGSRAPRRSGVRASRSPRARRQCPSRPARGQPIAAARAPRARGRVAPR